MVSKRNNSKKIILCTGVVLSVTFGLLYISPESFLEELKFSQLEPQTADAFGVTPWSVGTPIKSGDTYHYHLCDKTVRGTFWGYAVVDDKGCFNMSITFYGPFADANKGYWLLQVDGTHPRDETKKTNAMLTLRLSTMEVKSIFDYKALGTVLEKTLFYTSDYDRTNLNVGTTWKSRDNPNMVVYQHANNVYFAGYRDSDGRTNGMSFSPTFPLPLSAEMPDHGFSFSIIRK